MAEPTIAEKIEENAKGPARGSVDGTTVEAQNINDQIPADKYRSQKAATAKNHLGLTFRQLVPGACG